MHDRAIQAILIVEDDRDVADTIRELLQDAGYEAVCVENGQRALAWIQEHGRPAAILLDLMMPVMNGWRFIGELRSQPGLATVPVLVVTTVAAHWGFPVPSSHVITKPFDFETLLERLAAVLR